MSKANKGLADADEGEFILNESGTSVSVDSVEGIDEPIANDEKIVVDKVEKTDKTSESKEK